MSNNKTSNRIKLNWFARRLRVVEQILYGQTLEIRDKIYLNGILLECNFHEIKQLVETLIWLILQMANNEEQNVESNKIDRLESRK